MKSYKIFKGNHNVKILLLIATGTSIWITGVSGNFCSMPPRETNLFYQMEQNSRSSDTIPPDRKSEKTRVRKIDPYDFKSEIVTNYGITYNGKLWGCTDTSLSIFARPLNIRENIELMVNWDVIKAVEFKHKNTGLGAFAGVIVGLCGSAIAVATIDKGSDLNKATEAIGAAILAIPIGSVLGVILEAALQKRIVYRIDGNKDEFQKNLPEMQKYVQGYRKPQK